MVVDRAGWRAGAWLFVGGAVLLVLAAVLVHPWDTAIGAAVPAHLHRGGDGVLAEWVAMVRPYGRAEFTIFVALALGAAGARRWGRELLVSLLVSVPPVWILKYAVDRVRPTGEGHSFPSGDAATAAVLVPLAYFALRGRWRWLTVLVAGLAGSVAAARVLKGFHWPSDVATGMAVGLVSGWVGHHLARRMTWNAPSWAWLVGAVSGWGWCTWDVWSRMRQGDAYPITANFLFVVTPVALAAVMAARSPRHRAPSAWVWGAAALLAVTALAGATSLIDRDETQYARVVQELHDGASYLVPTYLGRPFLDKPPLVCWAMAAVTPSGAVHEIGFRLPAILSLVVSLLVMGVMARRARVSPGVAVAALGTMPLMLVIGSAATTDGLLLVGCVGAMAAWWSPGVPITTWSWARVAVGGAALGMGLLAKAPVGGVVPGLSLAVYAALQAWRGRPVRVFVREVAVASCVGGAMYLAWALPANVQSGGMWWREGILLNVIDRARHPMESHGGSFWWNLPYYVPVLLLGALPWSMLALRAVPSLWRPRDEDTDLRDAVVAWFVPNAVLMSLVATKLPHYLVPSLPAVAVAVAWAVDRAVAGGGAEAWGRWAGRLILGVGGVVGVALMVAPWCLPVDDIRSALLGAGLVFVVMCVAVQRHGHRRPYLAVRWGALGMVMFVLALAWGVGPRLNPWQPAPYVADQVAWIERRVGVRAGTLAVSTWGYLEPGLHVYLHPRPVQDVEDHGGLEAWAAQPGPGVLVMNVRKHADGIARARAAGLWLVQRRRGFDVARGRMLDVVTVVRGLAPAPSQAQALPLSP